MKFVLLALDPHAATQDNPYWIARFYPNYGKLHMYAWNAQASGRGNSMTQKEFQFKLFEVDGEDYIHLKSGKSEEMINFIMEEY